MPKRVLFVDDEPLVLGALRRVLRPLRNEWDMEFVSSGEEALKSLDISSFDAIVSDMKMPGMSGADLLEAVRMRYPRMLRFILSGESDRELALRAAQVAHQYIAKPCDATVLRQALAQAFALRGVLSSNELKKVVSQIAVLPSMPQVYTELIEATESASITTQELGTIIGRDLGLASSLLKLANSPLFGFRSQVSSIAQAVSILGVETLKALVLSISVFAQEHEESEFSSHMEAVWQHSLKVAQSARDIARTAGVEQKIIDDSFTAGILHDVGELVLVWKLPKQWRRIIEVSALKEISACEAEYSVLGCSHAEIGAYLAGSWCLPEVIIETIGWHHRPSESLIQRVCPLVFVHLAHANEPCIGKDTEKIDQEFLSRCGIHMNTAHS